MNEPKLVTYSKQVGKSDNYFYMLRYSDAELYYKMVDEGDGNLSKGYFAMHGKAFSALNKVIHIFYYLKDTEGRRVHELNVKQGTDIKENARRNAILYKLMFSTTAYKYDLLKKLKICEDIIDKFSKDTKYIKHKDTK